MKFIESLNGTLVNLNEICKITYEQDANTVNYYSYLYLKDGSKMDFIDLVTHIEYDGDEKKLDYKHFSLLNKHALECCLSDGCILVKNSKIENYAYNELKNSIFLDKSGEL